MKNSFLSWVDKMSEWSGRITSWGILLMIASTCFEVVARYFFGRPTDWAYELTTFVYGGYCLLVGAYTNRHDGHIRMDVLYNSLSPRWKARFDFFTGLLAIAFLAAFFFIMSKFAFDSWRIDEVSSETTWCPKMYPFKMTLALGVLLLLLARLGNLVHDFSNMSPREAD
jgi:TRAP-type mannitol/chloroaromatic compound transport system permease small subunit